MAVTNLNRSVPDILRDLLMQLTTLVRKEGQLARAEISENISRAGGGMALVVVGAVLLIPALVILLQAAVAALATEGFTPAQSAGIIGGATLVIGLILLAVGVGRLKARSLMPDRTINQLQRDAAVAKEQMRQDDERERAA